MIDDLDTIDDPDERDALLRALVNHELRLPFPRQPLPRGWYLHVVPTIEEDR